MIFFGEGLVWLFSAQNETKIKFLKFYEKLPRRTLMNFSMKVIVPWRLKIDLNDVSGKNPILWFLVQTKREMSPKWSFPSFIKNQCMKIWFLLEITANLSWIFLRRLNLAILADTICTLVFNEMLHQECARIRSSEIERKLKKIVFQLQDSPL